MPKLHVHTKFALRADDGSTREFPVGLHEFSKEEADHWYVGLHVAEPKNEEAAALSEKDADALGELESELKAESERLSELAASNAREHQAMLDDLDAREAEVIKREAAIEAREAALVDREKAASAREQEAATAQAKGSYSKPGNSKK